MNVETLVNFYAIGLSLLTGGSVLNAFLANRELRGFTKRFQEYLGSLSRRRLSSVEGSYRANGLDEAADEAVRLLG